MAPPGNQAETENTNIDLQRRKKLIYSTQFNSINTLSIDHILFDITPNITYWEDMENSLEKYLDSLEKVNALDVEIVLTGHRRLVHDLRGRVKELQEHHRARLNEVLVALGDGEKNIFQTAPHLSWDITAKTWEKFPAQQKWFAFGETMAHVKYLEGKGIVRSKNRNGTIVYSLV